MPPVLLLLLAAGGVYLLSRRTTPGTLGSSSGTPATGAPALDLGGPSGSGGSGETLTYTGTTDGGSGLGSGAPLEKPLASAGDTYRLVESPLEGVGVATPVAKACVAEATALDDVPYMFTSESSKRGLIIGTDIKKLLKDPALQSRDALKYAVYVLNDELKNRLLKDPVYLKSPTSFIAKPGSPEARIVSLVACLGKILTEKFPEVALEFKPGVVVKSDALRAGSLGKGGFGS